MGNRSSDHAPLGLTLAVEGGSRAGGADKIWRKEDVYEKL